MARRLILGADGATTQYHASVAGIKGLALKTTKAGLRSVAQYYYAPFLAIIPSDWDGTTVAHLPLVLTVKWEDGIGVEIQARVYGAPSGPPLPWKDHVVGFPDDLIVITTDVPGLDRYNFGLLNGATRVSLPWGDSGSNVGHEMDVVPGTPPAYDPARTYRIQLGGVVPGVTPAAVPNSRFLGPVDALITYSVDTRATTDPAVNAPMPTSAAHPDVLHYFGMHNLSVASPTTPGARSTADNMGTGLTLTATDATADELGTYDGWDLNTAPAALALNPATLDIAATAGSAPPGPVSVTATNTGGSSLGAITLGALTGPAAPYLTPSVVGTTVTLTPNGVPGRGAPSVKAFSLVVNSANGGSATLTGNLNTAAVPSGPRATPLYVSRKVFNSAGVQVGLATPTSTNTAVATFVAAGEMAKVTTTGAGTTALSLAYGGETDDLGTLTVSAV